MERRVSTKQRVPFKERTAPEELDTSTLLESQLLPFGKIEKGQLSATKTKLFALLALSWRQQLPEEYLDRFPIVSKHGAIDYQCILDRFSTSALVQAVLANNNQIQPVPYPEDSLQAALFTANTTDPYFQYVVNLEQAEADPDHPHSPHWLHLRDSARYWLVACSFRIATKFARTTNRELYRSTPHDYEEVYSVCVQTLLQRTLPEFNPFSGFNLTSLAYKQMRGATRPLVRKYYRKHLAREVSLDKPISDDTLTSLIELISEELPSETHDPEASIVKFFELVNYVFNKDSPRNANALPIRNTNLVVAYYHQQIHDNERCEILSKYFGITTERVRQILNRFHKNARILLNNDSEFRRLVTVYKNDLDDWTPPNP